MFLNMFFITAPPTGLFFTTFPRWSFSKDVLIPQICHISVQLVCLCFTHQKSKIFFSSQELLPTLTEMHVLGYNDMR